MWDNKINVIVSLDTFNALSCASLITETNLGMFQIKEIQDDDFIRVTEVGLVNLLNNDQKILKHY